MKRLYQLLLVILLSCTFIGCRQLSVEQTDLSPDGQIDSHSEIATDASEEEHAAGAIDVDAYYYDLEHVVLYLESYGELPSNYITKEEAREAGWEGGVPTQAFEGAAIGGNRFGNYEGLLPELPRDSQYRECDLNTNGARSRGAERLIYTDDGDVTNGCEPYYYTADHYESFSPVEVIQGEVIIDE